MNVQFEHAHGDSGVEKVEAYHKSLVKWVRDAHFDGAQFKAAKAKLLTILEGLSANIGFESLRGLTADDVRAGSKLESARANIDSAKFLASLSKYSDWAFDERGLGLALAPDVWLKTNDIAVSESIDPHIFKNRLFEITGFEQSGSDYQFRASASGGFFMMSHQLREAHFIGFGKVDSLFGLSTLAHEIGHSTTPRERSLDKTFLSLADSDDGLLISNEDESYLYERVFLQNANPLLARSGVNDGTDFAELLLKRKAIQNNLHLLKHRMNWLYFSGVSLGEIADQFAEGMREINPVYATRPECEFHWLKYATLDQPISRIGYLTAFQKNFAS